MKRGARAAVEAEIAKALEKLEQEDATADELKKAQLGVKRAMCVNFPQTLQHSRLTLVIGKKPWLLPGNFSLYYIIFVCISIGYRTYFLSAVHLHSLYKP